MLPIFSDPDYTGWKQDTPETSFWDKYAQFWKLTDEQWYIIARIMFREYVRVHHIGDMANADPDDAELAGIVQTVRQALIARRADPNYKYIGWSDPIPWRAIARQSYYEASFNNPGIRQLFGNTGTPFPGPEVWDYSAVDNDWTYANGLSAWGATLDTWEGYSDPVNAARYEFALDTMFRQVLGYSLSESTSSAQQQQAATVEEKRKGIGSAYVTAGDTGGGSTPTPTPTRTTAASWPTVIAVGLAAAIGISLVAAMLAPKSPPLPAY